MQRISLLAFFVGNLCDILLYIGGNLVLTMYARAHVTHPGMSHDQIHAATFALRAHGMLRLISYAVVPLAAVVAGFVGGTFGNQNARLNGTLSNVLCFCLGLMILATHASRDPISIQLGLLLLGIAAAVLGGTLARLSLRTSR